jgi:hypothetical protein
MLCHAMPCFASLHIEQGPLTPTFSQEKKHATHCTLHIAYFTTWRRKGGNKNKDAHCGAVCHLSSNPLTLFSLHFKPALTNQQTNKHVRGCEGVCECVSVCTDRERERGPTRGAGGREREGRDGTGRATHRHTQTNTHSQEDRGREGGRKTNQAGPTASSKRNQTHAQHGEAAGTSSTGGMEGQRNKGDRPHTLPEQEGEGGRRNKGLVCRLVLGGHLGNAQSTHGTHGVVPNLTVHLGPLRWYVTGH